MELATQLVTYGILLGCIFAFVSLGLSLIFGVMNIVNFAHGEFMMVGMYVAFLMSSYLPLDPLVSLPFAGALGFLLGVISYRLLITHILRGPMVAQLFGTFGLMLFLRYLVMFIFGPDVRTLSHGILVGKTFSLGWVSLDASKVMAAGLCLLFFAFVYWMINRTKLGRALRATSTPTVGMLFILIAFATVALGGFGSISGAFLAGIIIGLIQVLGGHYLSELKFTFIYIAYFLTVVLRPRGLFGW